MRCLDIVALVISLALTVSGQDSARYRELRRVVDRNVGHAHGTRGMNAFTLYALRGCVGERDIPVLEALLGDRDRITRMTAANVLVDLSEAGRQIVRAHLANAPTPRDRALLSDALMDWAEPNHRAILDYPLTESERHGIHGCRAAR